MQAIEAKTFSGYGGLRQTELPRPQPAKDRVLVRVTTAGVTPLEYTVLSGEHPRAKAPLVLGNEGAGVIEDAGDSGLALGSRVMFTGPYGVGENGTWQEWLLVRPEHLALVPDAIDDVVAASVPVAYLTAQVTLTLAGFKPGKLPDLDRLYETANAKGRRMPSLGLNLPALFAMPRSGRCFRALQSASLGERCGHQDSQKRPYRPLPRQQLSEGRCVPR